MKNVEKIPKPKGRENDKKKSGKDKTNKPKRGRPDKF